jgi:hypothetical protein
MSMRTVIDCVKASLENSGDSFKGLGVSDTKLCNAVAALEDAQQDEDKLAVTKAFTEAFFELIAMGVKLEIPIIPAFAELHKARYKNREAEVPKEVYAEVYKASLRSHLSEEGDIIK